MSRYCADCVHFRDAGHSCARQYDPVRYNLVTGDQEYRIQTDAHFERGYTWKQGTRRNMDVCGVEAVYFMPNPERPWAGMDRNEEVVK